MAGVALADRGNMVALRTDRSYPCWFLIGWQPVLAMAASGTHVTATLGRFLISGT